MAWVQGSLAAVTWTLRKLFINYPGPKQAGNNWNQGRLREKSVVGEQEESILEVTGSNFRSTAMNAGRSYRMAEGSGRNRTLGEAMGPMHGTPTDLPSHLIRSKRETAPTTLVEEESSQASKAVSVPVSGFASGISEETEVEGFDGDALESIIEELYIYVCDALSEIGKDTPVTEQIIMDCIPMFNLKTKNQSSTTKDFNRAVKDIRPRTNGDYISVREWWKAINLLADDYGWSLRMRVTFMRRTGGLAPKLNDDIVRRVKDLMDHPESWVRSEASFEASKPESNQRYWLYIWVDVGLKLISEFHQIQQVDEVERQLAELMEEDRFKIFNHVDDPLNSQFHKVQSLYKAMNVWLRDRSSALVDSPLYVWKLLVEWLKSSKPVGPLMLTHINKALNMLGTNVLEAIPRGHGRSKTQLEAMRRKGVMGATEGTYGLILEKLKLKAVNGELTMEVRTFSQLRDIQEQAQSDDGPSVGRKKRSAVKVNAVSTDYNPSPPSVSTMTLNTTSATPRSGKRYPLCQTCRLFHNVDKVDGSGNPICLFFDAVQRKFKVKGFLAHRNVLVMNKEGKKSVSEYWIKKLEQYMFPATNITSNKEKAKIVKDIRDAAAELPRATTAEIKQYAEDSKRFVAMVEKEDKTNINELRGEVNLLVNMASKLSSKSAQDKKSAKRARQKEKKRAAKASADEESDSDSEDDSEDDSESDRE
jgi:hypothetical protein